MGLVRRGRGRDETVSFMLMEWEKREGMRAWGGETCGHLNYLPLDIFSLLYHLPLNSLGTLNSQPKLINSDGQRGQPILFASM
jgi:hypothetical protein